jgi:hypothetical protein
MIADVWDTLYIVEWDEEMNMSCRWDGQTIFKYYIPVFA